MKRYPQKPAPSHVTPTRAIAWSALFFAFLSFLLSLATLLLTYKDGKLVRNIHLSTQAIHESVSAFKEASGEARAADRSSPKAAVVPSPVQWDKLRERLERVEEMMRNGDQRARFYLENITHDLELWRAVASSPAAAWMAGAAGKMKEIQNQMSTDGPAASRRLKELAAELQRKARGGVPEKEATSSPAAQPSPAAQAETSTESSQP